MIRKISIFSVILLIGFAFCLTSIHTDNGDANDPAPDANDPAPEDFQRTPNNIIGGNDIEYMEDLPKNSEDYKLGQRVAFLWTDKPGRIGRCTGFLIGPDLLMTNDHCIRLDGDDPSSPTVSANDIKVYMGFYHRSWPAFKSAVYNGTVKADATATRIIRTNPTKDYALLRLNRPIGWEYGWLGIVISGGSYRGNTSLSVKIIHHAGGERKQISRRNSRIMRPQPNKYYKPWNLAYLADTLGGASGAPVFLRDGATVIAINHSGVSRDRKPYFNNGTLMSSIYPEIYYWPPAENKFDLGVRAPRVSKTTLRPGEQFTFTIDAGNRSSLISDRATLKFYIKKGNGIRSLVATRDLGYMSANRYNTYAQTLRAPTGGAAPGKYRYYACVNTNRDYFDRNSSNNCSDDFEITVSNRSPEFLSSVPVNDIVATAGQAIPGLFLPGANDGDGDRLTYSIVGRLPKGLIFNRFHRTLTGIPTTEMGKTTYTYQVDDGYGGIDTIRFSITVNAGTGTPPPPSTNLMYWTSRDYKIIQRANLDGTNSEDIVIGSRSARNIALDVSARKMYWTDSDEIWRANLNGTNIEVLLTGLGIPSAIALDVSARKMYWTDTGKIHRANLDGTNSEVLLTGVNSGGIALDVSAGKMYWTDLDTDGIRRANLNGTNIENLVPTRLGFPRGIALDVSARKMYWIDADTGKIHRANLDGTNSEVLLTGLGLPQAIALDVSAGKMYWTDNGTRRILWANLDGTNIEVLLTGLGYPGNIALDIPQEPAGLRFNPSTIADQTFPVNAPIVPVLLPLATGGTPPYTYTLSLAPIGLAFNTATRSLSGTPTRASTTNMTYTATDITNASTSLTFTIEVTGSGPNPLDVNGDGQVDVLDLVLVAVFYGTRGNELPADVNTDGIVNVQDFADVAAGVDAAAVQALPPEAVEQALLAAAAQAAALEAAAGAPVAFGDTPRAVLSFKTAYGNVTEALADARVFVGDPDRLGKWMPLLEGLLQTLAELTAIPETTALLPNYPNPFNPETWIPYHLSKAANVTLTIYDVRGSVVRELALGHQAAGVYQSRGRAAYWDGRNNIGEPVASGVYFYTLTAGDFTATRKLLIAK